MNSLFQNVRFAARQLRRSPGFTAIAVVSLALGIGANAAIFSLFDQILLSSLPVHEPARLVNLAAPGPKGGSISCGQAGGCDAVFSYPMFRDLEEHAGEAVIGIAAHRIFGANLAAGEQTLAGGGLLVSGSYFPVLGLRPALGRLLGPADDRVVGGAAVAVLSHRFWESRFGADPTVLDRTILVNGYPMTVVGVAPEGFEGTTLGNRPDVFVPITMRGAVIPGIEPGFDNRRAHWAYLFARLRPGTGLEQARAGLNRIYQPIIHDVEAPLQQGMSEQTLARFRARELTLEEGSRGQSTVHREARTPLILLLAITGIVLLITCANIANLLLARGARRTQELAVRSSLGARRRQLLGQLLTESCLLALVGGIASLLMAQWTLSFIGTLTPPEVAVILDLELRPAALAFTAALSLGTGFLFGMYPAIHATRPGLFQVLRSHAAQASGARAAVRFRSALVSAQIALSMALLVSAGLFVRSLLNVSRVDLGLRADNVATFDISPGLNGYDPTSSRALFDRVEAELAAIPGVSSVSAATIGILRGDNWANDVSVAGFDSAPDVDATAAANEVGPGYFLTLGIALVAGREFTDADAAGTPWVAIVNRAFARKFGLDDARAVGTRMAIGRQQADLDIEIVGLVEDARYSDVTQEPPAMYFMPWRQNARLGTLTFYARTTTEPEPVLAAVAGVVQRIDPNLPVQNLKTLRRQVRENVFMERMISTLSAAFAALATLLAAIGLYGVMAYTVAQRTREIGLRMALGAGTRHVRSMVLRQVGRMTAIGGAIGIVAALALGRATRSLLFEVVGHDPWVVAAGAGLLALVALAAGFLPARRATMVEPMAALKAD